MIPKLPAAAADAVLISGTDKASFAFCIAFVLISGLILVIGLIFTIVSPYGIY